MLLLFGVLPAFSCFCSWCVAYKYGSVSRFKAVFGGFWGADVYLYGLGALRGLCGFCARVELGGLKTFCVFAPRFILLHQCLPSFMLVVLLCSDCLSLFSCVVFVALWVWSLFLFPFRTKRKRAHLFCALSLLGFGVFILNYLMR